MNLTPLLTNSARLPKPLSALAIFSTQPSSLLLLLLSLLGTIVPNARAANPTAAMGYVVATDYTGVHTDGTNPGTTTSGLQAAINDAYANDRVLYLPPGTYAINDTLKAYTNTANNPAGSHHLAIVGSTSGATRPVIKVHSTATLFDDTTNPKVMLEFKNFDTDDFSNPDTEKPSAGFYQMLRGVDLDCGGKHGAIGLYFNQAQDSSIENVKVTATNAHTGIRGLPNRAWGAVNIEVEGGLYGIDTTPTAGGNNPKGSVGAVIAGLKLSNQVNAAIVNPGYTLTIVGFEITTLANTANPAVLVAGATGDDIRIGSLALIDGWIQLTSTFSGGVAISNPSNRNVYMRNVYVSGSNSGNLVQSGTNSIITGTGTYKRIDEYSYGNQDVSTNVGRETWDLINGSLDRNPSPLNDGEVKTITNSAPAQPSDFITRHTWATLPSVDDADYYDPVALGDITIDPLTGTANVSSATLQSLIDSHPKIFLQKGIYKLSGPITLRKDTVIFGAARHLTRFEVDTTAWNPMPTTETPVITTDSDATAMTYIGDLSIGVPSDVLANDYFTAVNWNAGKNSMVHIARPYHNPQSSSLTTNDHSLFKIQNSGGGRWYFLGRGQSQAMHSAGYRILKITGTTEPLWIYGLNMEHAGGVKFGEFSSASNIRIYSVKTEYQGAIGTADYYGTSLLSFNNCKNVGVFGQTAITHSPDANYSVLEFNGSSTTYADRLLAALVTPSKNDASTPPGNLISESIGGLSAAAISWPNAAGLYKRGTITTTDESTMSHLNIGYGSLPAGWTQRNIGAVGDVGSAFYGDTVGTFTLNGSGADIWGTADEFCFVSKLLSGDKTVIARVVALDNTDANAKAGVMIREVTANNARFADMVLTPGNGTRFQYRSTAGGSVANGAATNTDTGPYWVKLVRSGNVITASKSPDGATWTQVGSVTLSGLASSVYIGLATCSHLDGTLNTAVFDNVSVN